MGKINLHYYGVLAEIAGSGKEEIENISDLNNLKSLLQTRYPEMDNYHIVYAVNNTIVRDNFSFNNNESVALMPPFSGG
jgi:molybdopterin synthase sulfur carrier subunit